MDIEANGEPLLKRDVVGHIRKKSIYSVAREADEGEAKGTMTPQMVIELFCKAFEKEYNTKYNVVWQRDTRPVKTKLIKNYTDDEIKTIIEMPISYLNGNLRYRLI